MILGWVLGLCLVYWTVIDEPDIQQKMMRRVTFAVAEISNDGQV